MDVDPLSPQPDHDAHDRVALNELIDLGTSMARLVHRRTAELTEDCLLGPREMEAATVAFDRMARCVRRTVALARRLDTPVVVRPAREWAGARTRVIRGVEDAITAGRETDEFDDEAAERLREDLRERLDRPEFASDLVSKSIEEIIAEIRRDLGIVARGPWARRTPAEIDEVGALTRPKRTRPPDPMREAMKTLSARENPWPGDPRRLWRPSG